MKNLISTILIASFFIAGCFPRRQVVQSDDYNYSDNYSYSDDYSNTDISYQTFYNELQPYGNWINYPEYGTVWQPSVRNGFRPYETGGRWVSTVDGWAWASDYNWGWAPFHYGRWFFDQSIGWAWVPGYEWAPAWVTWGQYNDYYAWAPLTPGINISFGNTWRAPSNYWSYVPRNCINYSNLNRYTVNNYNTNVNNITIINNYNSYNQSNYYHRGPDYQEVERFTRKPITPVGIASTNRPGLSRVVNRQLEVYRPSMSPNAANSNSSTRQITVPDKTRVYNGAVRENSKPEASINAPDNNRIRKNPNLNKVPVGDNRDVLSNGINNGSSNVTQQDIDNTNRRLQQQQNERIRKLRTSSPGTSPSIPENPVRTRQIPQNNQQSNQQNDLRQPPVKNNFPADNVQPTRPQSRMQEERIMQRPAFPQQNERIMRQPQAPSVPNRMESRGATPPVRSIPPIQRPGSRQL